MNFETTKKTVEAIFLSNLKPIIIGTQGVGKTAMASEIANDNEYGLVVIECNTLKEGEIGGLV